MTDDTFVLDVEWVRARPDAPKLPNLLGPFRTRTEAEEWAGTNIPNGSWEVRPLAWPYLTGGVKF